MQDISAEKVVGQQDLWFCKEICKFVWHTIQRNFSINLSSSFPSRGTITHFYGFNWPNFCQIVHWASLLIRRLSAMLWETSAKVTKASICNERAHFLLAAVVSDGQKSELSQILRIKALALHNVWRLWYRKRCPNRLGDNPWQTDMLAQRFRSSDNVFPNQVFFNSLGI